MFVFTRHNIAVSVFTVTILAGCGGGGEGAQPNLADNPSSGTDDTPLVVDVAGITNANANFAAAAALYGMSSGMMASSASEIPIEVPSSPAKTLYTIVDAGPCGLAVYGGGGTMTVTFDDVDDDQELSPPDTFTTAFAECKFISDPYVINGAMIITNGSTTGNPVANAAPWTFAGTMTFVDYGTSASYEKVVTNGKLDFDASSTDGKTQTSQTTSSDMVVVFNDKVTVQYDELDTTVTQTAGSGIDTARATIKGKGRITGCGEVTFSTLSPWVYQGFSDYPSQGSSQFVSANGSSVIVTAINNETVELRIDSNGDGQADSVRERSWDALLQP